MKNVIPDNYLDQEKRRLHTFEWFTKRKYEMTDKWQFEKEAYEFASLAWYSVSGDYIGYSLKDVRNGYMVVY